MFQVMALGPDCRVRGSTAAVRGGGPGLGDAARSAAWHDMACREALQRCLGKPAQPGQYAEAADGCQRGRQSDANGRGRRHWLRQAEGGMRGPGLVKDRSFLLAFRLAAYICVSICCRPEIASQATGGSEEGRRDVGRFPEPETGNVPTGTLYAVDFRSNLRSGRPVTSPQALLKGALEFLEAQPCLISRFRFEKEANRRMLSLSAILVALCGREGQR